MSFCCKHSDHMVCMCSGIGKSGMSATSPRESSICAVRHWQTPGHGSGAALHVTMMLVQSCLMKPKKLWQPKPKPARQLQQQQFRGPTLQVCVHNCFLHAVIDILLAPCKQYSQPKGMMVSTSHDGSNLPKCFTELLLVSCRCTKYSCHRIRLLSGIVADGSC